MKIAFLIQSAFGIGGTIRTVLTQAEALSARHEVELVSVFRPREVPMLGLAPTVHLSALVDLRIPAPSRLGDGGRRLHEGDPRAGEAPEIYPEGDFRSGDHSRLTDDRIARFLAETDADVVVTTRAGLNVAAALLAPDRLPVVGQEHMPVTAYKESFLAVLRETYPRLAALATVTEADARAFGEWMPSSGPLLRAIPNAVPAPGLIAEGPPSKIVTAAGRLVPSKRFDILIDAFARLRREFPDWQLHIHGKGELKAALRQQVHSLGLSDSVFLMGAHPRLEEGWALGALAAQTSRKEAFGLTIAEAMRSGLPVVSTDCPNGPAEIIRHGEDGLLVKNRSAAAVAGGLAELMGDDRRRREMAAAARRNAARFDPREVAFRHEELLCAVTGSAAPMPASLQPSPHEAPDCRATATATGDVELEFAKPPDAVLLGKAAGQPITVSADDRSRFVVTAKHLPSPGRWTLHRVDGGHATPVVESQIDLRAHRGGQHQGDRLELCLPVRDAAGNLAVQVRRVDRYAEVQAVDVGSRHITITARLGEAVGAQRARLHLALRGHDTTFRRQRCRISPDGTLVVGIRPQTLAAARRDETDVWELSVHADDEHPYMLGRCLPGVAEHKPVVTYPELRLRGRGRRAPTGVTPYYTRTDGVLALRVGEASPSDDPPTRPTGRVVHAIGTRIPRRLRRLLRRFPAQVRRRMRAAAAPIDAR